MPYARTSYTLSEVATMLKGAVNTSVSQGGGGRSAPDPHAAIHAPLDELHRNPLFQRARVSSGDVGTHSVARDTDALAASLRAGLNSGPMQAFLAKMDPVVRAIDATWHPRRQEAVRRSNREAVLSPQPRRQNVWVDINFSVPQGTCDEHRTINGRVVSRTFRFRCLGVKLMVNPHNSDLPILQTCVPMENVKAGDSAITV